MSDLTLDKCPVCGVLQNTTVEGAACDACEENTRAEQDAFGDPPDTDDGPCWCGEPNPHYDDDLDDDCGGTGQLDCYCGGDTCVCHNHGSVECPGCDFCVYDEDDDVDLDLEEGDDDA